MIVNDIGEINVDASLIADGGLSETDDLIPLTNGCICCTLSDDLANQLQGIADSGNFDYIIIEATMLSSASLGSPPTLASSQKLEMV